MSEENDKNLIRSRLSELCQKVPKRVANGSYNLALDWKDSLKKALKTAKNTKATTLDLSVAVADMERYL